MLRPHMMPGYARAYTTVRESEFTLVKLARGAPGRQIERGEQCSRKFLSPIAVKSQSE